MQCYRHPNEEVFLRCGKCDRPICAKCTKHGPAGARCADCSSLSSSLLYQVSPTHMALGGLAGFATAFVLGYLISVASGFGFFLLWGGMIAGPLVAEVILRCTQRKRGVKMEILTGVATVAGVAASCAVWYVQVVQPGVNAGLTLDMVIRMHVFYFVALVLMVFSAVSRVRFF